MSDYLGKCKAKGCKSASRVAVTDVQRLDSDRWAKNAAGERMLITDAGSSYDRSRPFILNGVCVSARCPDHGVYRLQSVKGRLVPDHKCDRRCTGATGPKCDCSCGGANHGADHAR
jgi:hypothetical protein